MSAINTLAHNCYKGKDDDCLLLGVVLDSYNQKHRNILDSLCAKNNTFACYLFAIEGKNDNLILQNQKKMELLEYACKKEEAVACLYIAEMYYKRSKYNVFITKEERNLQSKYIKMMQRDFLKLQKRY